MSNFLAQIFYYKTKGLVTNKETTGKSFYHL